MNILVTIISICLAIFFLGQGCSREKQPPVQKTKVVKSIKMPVPEEVKTPVTVEEGKPKSEEEVVKSKPEEEAVKEERGEVKTAAIKEKTVKPPETKAKEKDTAMKKEAGYYIVKKGDTLSSIAGRKDVYGNPLKWPVLYRLNMDNLGGLEKRKGFPDKELPERVRKLKIVTSDEARKNLEKRANSTWVVNVLSTTTMKKIVPAATKLIKNGHQVYITSARVKGKDWLRLRVGFFKNKTDASTEGKRMMTILNLVDSWATQVGKKEFKEFGCY